MSSTRANPVGALIYYALLAIENPVGALIYYTLVSVNGHQGVIMLFNKIVW